jgi:ABC-2 type transport system permease protein
MNTAVGTPMSTASNAGGGLLAGPQSGARGGKAAPRPLYWSIRRELWENRSLYLAPLIAGAVIVLGYLVSLVAMPRSMSGMAHGMAPRAALAMPYAHTAWLMELTGLLVGVFYCLDALHGERRDRSILFWKSLPVSDGTTVLAKACIPLVVLQVIVLVETIVLQWIVLLLNMAGTAAAGESVGELWRQLPFFQVQIGQLYFMAVIVLWHAPIYAWLLLVSGWAKRTTFLWAFLPWLALAVFERIAFHSWHLAVLLGHRMFGGADKSFTFRPADGSVVDPHFIPLAALTPGRFLSTPGLWIGLACAAIFLGAAVRLRRYREPI